MADVRFVIIIIEQTLKQTSARSAKVIKFSFINHIHKTLALTPPSAAGARGFGDIRADTQTDKLF